jgi:hypothetical protein
VEKKFDPSKLAGPGVSYDDESVVVTLSAQAVEHSIAGLRADIAKWDEEVAALEAARKRYAKLLSEDPENKRAALAIQEIDEDLPMFRERIELYDAELQEKRQLLRKLSSTDPAGVGRSSTLTRAERVKKNQERFIADALAIEAESAQEAGALGYMARVLVQATMPHSAKEGNEFSRTNGRLHVSILAPSGVGLPYGAYPRLLLAWLTTEAVKTKSGTLYLGDSLSEFMGKLGLLPTGGRWGTIPRLRDQADRLFTSYVTAYEADGEKRSRGGNIMVADEWDLWWDPKAAAADQGSLFQSWVKLTDRFYQQVTDRPVPIDLRAIRALKKSPLALDLYAWSTYRVSYLGKRTEIPWEALQMQFGADYADTPQGKRDFKRKLLDALRKVSTVYPELRAGQGESGLVLMPSPPHIRRIK